IALTATSSSGLAKAANTSVAREYHAGMATMAGIQAVRAAQRGYKAEERILEMKLGFFEAVGGVDGNEGAALATRDRGGSWDIVTGLAGKRGAGGPPPPPRGGGGARAAPPAQAGAGAVADLRASRPRGRS